MAQIASKWYPPQISSYLPFLPLSIPNHKLVIKTLFLILSSQQLSNTRPILQLLLQKLINRERDRLPRSNSHNSWRNSLVKSMETLLFKHIGGNRRNPLPRRDSWHSWGFLEACLDGVDWCVGERTHCSRDQADDGGLVGWKLRGGVGLVGLENLLEFGVGGEVYGLVGTWSIRLAACSDACSCETT